LKPRQNDTSNPAGCSNGLQVLGNFPTALVELALIHWHYDIRMIMMIN